MRLPRFISKKPLLYAVYVLLGASLCWKALTALGLPDPIWAVITVILVSDPDLSTAMTLSKMRVINTIVGCIVGIVALLIFGYSPWISFLAASAIIVVITSVENYPANWRLTPVTVFIVMSASKTAVTPHDEVYYALMRACEIIFGCMVALGIAAARVKTTLLVRSLRNRHDWE